MSDTITFGELSEWQRAEMARHFGQTYHLNYGGMERQDALIFRLAPDDPAVIRTEAPAVLLRQLAAAARPGTAVKAPRMSKGDAVRFSELLRQSADRSAREARDDSLTRALTQLWWSWDQSRRVPADEYERAEHVRFI